MTYTTCCYINFHYVIYDIYNLFYVVANIEHFNNAYVVTEKCDKWPDSHGQGCGNLQTYCLQFCGNQTLCCSHHLYSWDPAEHLHFVDLCNFRTMDIFKCTCLATAAGIWNELLVDLILNGEASGWWTILKDVQHCVRTWLLPYVCVWALLQ